MSIKTIGVVGAGQMGAGIAQVFAAAGFDVIMHDVDNSACERGMKAIGDSLNKMASKGKISEGDRDSAMSKIKTTTVIEDLGNADFLIEAVSENLQLKLEIFKKLDEIAGQGVILASNTSSLSIAKLASVTKRPDKVIGMHFMNPVPVIKGVEVISSTITDNSTAKTVAGLAEKIGKTVIRSKDKAGFVANRILMPMINEAIYAYAEKIAARDDIDSCMTVCCNFPMGPLALADLIGLDTVQSILNVMYEDFGDPKYKPCPILDQYVSEGRLGRKSGKGFYDY